LLVRDVEDLDNAILERGIGACALEGIVDFAFPRVIGYVEGDDGREIGFGNTRRI
jgi:hypothetical protein